MSNPELPPLEYALSISANNIHDAIRQVTDALYALVEEALATHEEHEADECDFELFARDILGVLDGHADFLEEEKYESAEPLAEDSSHA